MTNNNLIQVQARELEDFLSAVSEKIVLANEHNNKYLVQALNKIEADIQKWIGSFKDLSVSFSDAYKEITSLYVFTEISLKPDYNHT